MQADADPDAGPGRRSPCGIRGVSCEPSRFQLRHATFHGTDAAKSRMVATMAGPGRRGIPAGTPRKLELVVRSRSASYHTGRVNPL